jgi:hypothetical protein
MMIWKPMKGSLVRQMRIFEILFALLSAVFLFLYLYDKKKLTLLKIRKHIEESRNRRDLSEIRPSGSSGLSEKAAFIYSVLMRRSLSYSEGRINIAAALILLSNLAVLTVILAAGDAVLLRILLQTGINLLLYKLLSEICMFRYKKDVNKLLTGLQNEILQENEIITSAKRAAGKMERSMLGIETDIILNEMIKNSRYPEQANFKIYLKKTLCYELPLIISFLSGACVSGDRAVIKRNLGELDKYCAQSFESFKDDLFSKIPYMAIILMLPLFLIWMDSFSSKMMFSGTAVSEPKEYIYLFSGLLAYMFLCF